MVVMMLMDKTRASSNLEAPPGSSPPVGSRRADEIDREDRRI